MLPVGTLLEGKYGIDGVVMGIPCVIGRDGVERIIECDLSDAEIDRLNESAEHIRQLASAAECWELKAS